MRLTIAKVMIITAVAGRDRRVPPGASLASLNGLAAADVIVTSTSSEAPRMVTPALLADPFIPPCAACWIIVPTG